MFRTVGKCWLTVHARLDVGREGVTESAQNTGGGNNSVRVAKRPFAPTAPERRSAATEYLMGVYTTRNNYCELTALKFRRPIALLSWKTTQTGHTDSIAPGHRHIGHFA